MQTKLAPKIQQGRHAEAIETILRNCVHCGFCNATCPTYQLRGDELDGPRGRIYQMKQFFEGASANAEMLKHLDRCLTSAPGLARDLARASLELDAGLADRTGYQMNFSTPSKSSVPPSSRAMVPAASSDSSI